MAKRWLICALWLALLLLSPIYAGAAANVTALEPGPWSNWQEEAIEEKDGIEVESQMRPVARYTYAWKYRRYVYFNLTTDTWFCAAQEIAGDFVRPESGYWDETELTEPLGVMGETDGETVYEGGWFNEEVVTYPVSEEKLQYRAREVKKVICEISTRELLLFPKKERRLTANLFDGAQGYYTWTSSDPAVATVDSQGNVRGVATGRAQVTVRSPGGREIVCEVFVCQPNAKIPEGTYTLRLGKSNKTLSVGKRISTSRSRLLVSDYTGDTTQRFLLNNVGLNNTFVLQPLSNRNMFVDVERGANPLETGNEAQVHKKRDKTAQYWRAVAVPDGSYILYPKANARLVLGAVPLEAGNGVRLENTSTQLETLDRWVLIPTGQSKNHTDSFLRPVIRDGQSYVTKNFGEQESKGLLFESNAKRVFVLSCARGKVKEVFADCAHDAPKTADETGAYEDVCGALGNYVVIDHGGGITVTYAHLSEIYVKVGDTVQQNSMIGRSGATGRVPDVCLYLEMRQDDQPIDPRAWISLPEKNTPIE